MKGILESGFSFLVDFILLFVHYTALGEPQSTVSRNLYSSVTVSEIVNGKHYKLAIQAHEITLEVLFNLQFSVFLKETPTVVYEVLLNALNNLTESCLNKTDVNKAHQNLLKVIEEINLEKQLMDFDNAHYQFPLYRWTRMYMKQVMCLLNFRFLLQ